MPTQRKIDTVTSLTSALSRAKSVVIADYRGLKHKQLEELRRTLKKVEAEFTIAKNRLFKRALGDKAEKLADSLSQTTAILFSYGDEIAPIKELLKFFKTAGTGTPKAGLLGDLPLTEADVTKLSTLPTHEVLLGQFVRQLNAPIQNLHYALQWNFQKLVYVLNAVKAR
jgi:large subunit ribosomal protein L10